MKNVNPEKFNNIVSVITKEQIINSDFEEIQNFYNQMLDNPIKYENKVHIIIQGFDNDQRELFEISEVREYFKVLDRLFPYWFYFIKKDNNDLYSSLKMIMFLLIPVKVIQHGKLKNSIEYDIPQFVEFMNIHFHYLNELTDKLGLSLEENKRISEQVLNVFK